MADILSFPTQANSGRNRDVAGPCQILLFTGVRVEYRERPDKVDLGRRAGRGRRPARRAN
ncbi:hypothetical protein [Afifella sp. IM 167]|uniref:hypothetical protein n=1 Tax=Afifella sp. IM 167 TaxID=2033586 RepID=UPI001CCF523A|nr:hypothetical protein [Afifella sp. IM 167]MBZ8133097.1 hypothetical protein [Afifella sp. IM 167]